MMPWTPDSIETWRDLSGLFGHNFETNHYFDRDSIHARRDMSVKARHDYEAIPCSDHSSIHACRDMSVTKPPHESSRPPTITEMTIFLTPPIIVNGHTT